VVKSADESRSASTSLADDGHLLLPIAANETFAFEFEVVVGTGAEAADIQVTLDAPTGAAGAWSVLGLPDSTTNPLAANLYNLADLGFGAASAISLTVDDTRKTAIKLTGVCVNGSTAGSVKLRWAQATSNATNTTVKKYSHAKAFR
jgi:hypothetical protein